MPIINLTDMTIRIADGDGNVVKIFEPDGEGLRLRTRGEERQVEGVPVELTHLSGVEGLPEPQDGTYYIVSHPVARLLGRPDLLTPDTGPTAIRDEQGDVYAVRRLYGLEYAR